MNDDERMIAAARRAARRLARRTGHPYQTCLDMIARDCSRTHWAHFMESPAAIPREEDRHAGVVEDSKEGMLRAIGRPSELREIWSVGDGELPEGWVAGMFMPRFNALAPDLVPADPTQRRLYVQTLAEALIPQKGAGNDDYFDLAGRRALSGFLLLTVEDMGEKASIPALIDNVNEGLRAVADLRDAAQEKAAREGRFTERPDYMAQWLGTIDLLVRDKGYDTHILDVIVPLVSMGERERSGVLGTMDKALLIFKSQAVRRRTA